MMQGSEFRAPQKAMNVLPSTHLSRRFRRFVAIMVATLVIVTVPVSSVGAASKKTAKCDASSGWTQFAGRAPSFVAGGATGLYVWQERGLWRIGATNDRGTPTTFAATVTFDAAISGKPVGTEGKSDIVDIRVQSVRLRFSNFGGLDGVQIDAPCASTISVKGEIDGQPMTAQQLFFGPAATNPTVIPGVIQRGAGPSSAGAASTTVGSQVAATATACSTAPWPAGLLGKPAFRKGPAGVYAWIEKGTLRVAFESDPGAPRLFEGRVVANAPVSVLSERTGRKDVVKASGQQVAFSLRVNALGDTFDVVSACATSFSLEGTVDGVALLPTQIFLGSAASVATAVPAIVSR